MIKYIIRRLLLTIGIAAYSLTVIPTRHKQKPFSVLPIFRPRYWKYCRQNCPVPRKPLSK